MDRTRCQKSANLGFPDKVTINNNTAVYDVFQVLNDNGITWKESNKLEPFILKAWQRNGVTYSEGW